MFPESRKRAAHHLHGRSVSRLAMTVRSIHHFSKAEVNTEPLKTLHYKKSRFVTQLPVDYVYSPSHAWAWRRAENIWRVGFTKFAVRMLGEMVDHGFEVTPGAPVKPGQMIGWIEGFKAVSDIYCIAEGEFAGANPHLKEQIQDVSKKPYEAGWLYEIKGRPDAHCMDVHAYVAVLDQTIQRILEKENAMESE